MVRGEVSVRGYSRYLFAHGDCFRDCRTAILVPVAEPSDPGSDAPGLDPGMELMDGYWNFIAAMILLLMIVYVTSKGQLPQWINLLSFVPAPTPSVGGTTPAQSQAAPGTQAPNQAFGLGIPSMLNPFGGPSSGQPGNIIGQQLTPPGQSILGGLLGKIGIGSGSKSP